MSYDKLVGALKHLPGGHNQADHAGNRGSGSVIGGTSGRLITSNRPLYTGKTASSSDGKRKWKLHDDGKSVHVIEWNADTDDMHSVKRFNYSTDKKGSKLEALKRAGYARDKSKTDYDKRSKKSGSEEKPFNIGNRQMR